MTILGLEYVENGSMKQNLNNRYMKGTSKVALVIQRLVNAGALHDPHICSLIVNADVRPTLLFGSNIWGMHGLATQDPVKHILQKPYSILMRKALCAQATLAHWIALLLTGHLPIQLIIIRDFLNFWNRCICTSRMNGIVKACIHAQSSMLALEQSCWLREWDLALRRCLPTHTYQHIHSQFVSNSSVDVQQCIQEMIMAYESLLTSYGDPTDPQCRHRRIAKVFKQVTLAAIPMKKPKLVYSRLPPHAKRVWTAFLAGEANIPANNLVGITSYSHRICQKCGTGMVADEPHVVFHCTHTQNVRQQYASTLKWPSSGTLERLLHENEVWTCACFIHDIMQLYCN